MGVKGPAFVAATAQPVFIEKGSETTMAQSPAINVNDIWAGSNLPHFHHCASLAFRSL